MVAHLTSKHNWKIIY